MPDQIVHTTQGRIRIRVPQLSQDPQLGDRVQQCLAALPFVTSVRINPAARSVIVAYTPDSINSSVVQECLLSCIAQAATAQPASPSVDFMDAAADATDRANWESEAEADLQTETDWQRLGLPLISLGLAVLAAPWELPPLVVGAAIAGAAFPWFHRAGDHLFNQRYLSVDLLDALWMGLHTLNGQFVAPALKTSLVGLRADLRDHTRGDRLSTQGYVAELLRTEPVYDTRIATQQAAFARSAVLPTLFLGAGIFATTGMYAAAIAPFQLDFGSGIQLSLRSVFLSALVDAARNGVYIRSAGALETLAGIDAIVCDHAELLQPPLVQNSLRNWGIEVHCLLPGQPRSERLDLLMQLQDRGKSIAFLGHGESDFGPQDQGCLSIAFAHPQEYNSITTDILLLEADALGLLGAIAVARLTLQRVYENTALIVIPNLVVVAGGVFWGLHPLWNVITNNLTALMAEFLLGNPFPFQFPPVLANAQRIPGIATANPVALPRLEPSGSSKNLEKPPRLVQPGGIGQRSLASQ
jgi:cation transport ATPase